MLATSKKRLCWNCDAMIPITLRVCPYCGQNASGEEEAETKESISSSPGYQFVGKAVEGSESSISPYQLLPEEEVPPPARHTPSYESTQAAPSSPNLLSLVALLAGSGLLFFGFLLLLFHGEESLTLQWKPAYWPFYVGLGICSLGAGWMTTTSSSS